MTYEITSISLLSMLRIVPIALLPLGLAISIYTFIINPSGTAREMEVKARLLSALIFIVLYTAIITGGLLLLVASYNFVTHWIKGVEIILR